MRMLVMFLLGIGMCLSINVFAVEVENNDPEKRVVSNDTNSNISGQNQQPVSVIDQNISGEKDATYDETVAPAEKIMKEYLKPNDEHSLHHNNESDTGSHNKSDQDYPGNKLSSGCKSVAEEAVPKHPLDENRQ